MQDEKKRRKVVSYLGLAIALLLGTSAFLVDSNVTNGGWIKHYVATVNKQDSFIVALKGKVVTLSDSLSTMYHDLETLYHFSWNNIEFWLSYYEVKFPEVAKAQIYLETANLTSRICLENNNLFGMKYAPGRENTAKGTRYGHAIYSNYIESIKDYSLYQQRLDFNKVKTNEDYMKLLKEKGYAEAKDYTPILKHIIEAQLVKSPLKEKS